MTTAIDIGKRKNLRTLTPKSACGVVEDELIALFSLAVDTECGGLEAGKVASMDVFVGRSNCRTQ
jgi:hypothetical protein